MKAETQVGICTPLYPRSAAHLQMWSRVSNGALSPANWARKIAGPLMVFMMHFLWTGWGRPALMYVNNCGDTCRQRPNCQAAAPRELGSKVPASWTTESASAAGSYRLAQQRQR